MNSHTVILGIFVPLATFAMFHMVSVFPLSWVFLYTDEQATGFLLIEALAAGFGLLAIIASGWLADRIGRKKLLVATAIAIAIFSVAAPVLLAGGASGETTYLIIGFVVLGLSFGQSSGAVGALFRPGYRYTGSAFVSDLAWLFGAGLAPLTALLLTTWFGLPAAGLYLLSGSVCTLIALWYSGKLVFNGN